MFIISLFHTGYVERLLSASLNPRAPIRNQIERSGIFSETTLDSADMNIEGCFRLRTSMFWAIVVNAVFGEASNVGSDWKVVITARPIAPVVARPVNHFEECWFAVLAKFTMHRREAWRVNSP